MLSESLTLCCCLLYCKACIRLQVLTQIHRLTALRLLCRYVKEADKDIIKHLRGVGRLIDSSNYTHSYPFCWRSDTPLIQRVGLFGPELSLKSLHFFRHRPASLL